MTCERECDDCILIAEDDANIRRLIALSLRREGYHLVEASNGRDALDLMRRGEAEVVVLDLMMPGLSGWDVLAERARDRQLQKIPVIVMSANAGERVAEVMNQDICAFLPKPFAIETLCSLVRSCLDEVREQEPS